MTKFDLRGEDCVTGMSQLTNESVDLVVTSPPYNLGIDYRQYADRQDRQSYLELVRRMVNTNSKNSTIEGIFFSEHWLRAIESDVAPSNRD